MPVLALYYQQMLSQGSSQCLVPEVDVASAVVTFTELLQASPDLPFSSEQDTSLYVCDFVRRVWRTLAKSSPTRLQYSLLFNKASQLSSVSSDAMLPDTMLIAESCTLMLGEDKHTDLAAAFADLERKRVDLSGMHYGPLKFMLGLSVMSAAVPPLPGRWPLYSQIERENSWYVLTIQCYNELLTMLSTAQCKQRSACSLFFK